MGKRKYNLDDLIKYSPWPLRLLGFEDFQKKSKTQKELDREYDKQKWSVLLKTVLRLKNKARLKDVEKAFFGNTKTLTYADGEFVLKSATAGQQEGKRRISDVILDHFKNSTSLVELGCGYGSIIIYLAKKRQFKHIKIFGAEKSKNGRRLTRIISKNEGVKIKIIN